MRAAAPVLISRPRSRVTSGSVLQASSGTTRDCDGPTSSPQTARGLEGSVSNPLLGDLFWDCPKGLTVARSLLQDSDASLFELGRPRAPIEGSWA